MSRVVRILLPLAAATWSVGFAQRAAQVPQIWNDADLVDWATPVAGLNARPAHYSSAEYYSVPADNLRTYPVYHPGSEPQGYWEELQKKKPEPLVDVSKTHGRGDWIDAGERAFREMDNFWSRTDDPALIAQARDPRSFDDILKLRDGTAFGPRWVVTPNGLMLSSPACSACHFTARPDGTVTFAGPGGPRPPGMPLMIPRGLGVIAAGAPRALQRFFSGDPPAMLAWRMFTVPWAPDERIERRREALVQGEFRRNDEGVFLRPHGSPFFATRIPDLHVLRYSKYLDATGTHRLRGPEDLARYAAFITGTDPMEFGPHRILSDAQRRVRFRYADEVLYAIGMYLMSLEPRKNPDAGPPNLVERGQRVFASEGCNECHAPPSFTTGKLTIAHGWQPIPNHPNAADILMRSIGTDPGLALRTRKGTGLYKIPSLRGVWYRPRLLHDGSLASLEEMFDSARLDASYRSKGWMPPDVTSRAVTGHLFGLKLSAEDKAALLAFLRSL